MENLKLGIRQNWKQFSLLVIVNAFVGGMIGLERTIFPQFAEVKFNIASKTALLAFIIVFGISKSLTNYFTGKLANKFGRKNLLIVGWLFALPVPLIFIFSDSWSLIIFANLLLGINQGLAWSSTVVMKVDLVGDKQRGFAMGLNEFAGYLAVAVVAYLTSFIASNYGVVKYPFYGGIAIVVVGLILSVFFVKDTQNHQKLESKNNNNTPRLKNIFLDTSLIHPNLGAVTQAGLVNNLNDGLVWGLFPIILLQNGFSLTETGFIAGMYPAVWGISQLFTGKLSDIYCKKNLLFWGMFLQGIVLIYLTWANSYLEFLLVSILLGFGTALVYPTFLATIAENTHPQDRAESLGIFRFWRDLGYAIGAILSGVLSDIFGMDYAINFIGILTIISSVIIFYRMICIKLFFHSNSTTP